MEPFICMQCGTQFAESAQPPSSCPICEDERQFVHYGGQQWTTLERLAADHHNRFEEEAPQLLGVGTEPEFAIGQGAFLAAAIMTVVEDRRYVSLMRSYENLIRLGPAAINRILETIEPFSLHKIYGGWWKADVLSDAKAAVARSAQRYLRAIGPAG